MLKGRLVSSFILIGILSALVWADHFAGSDAVLGRPGLCLAPLAIIAVILGTLELADLFRSGGLKSSTIGCLLVSLPTILCGCAPILWRNYPLDCPMGPGGWVGLGFALGICCVFLFEMYRFRSPGDSVMRLATAFFVGGYMGVLMSFLAWLRLYSGNDWGLVALLSMIIVVKLSDAGAYLIGKTLGRTRMAPVLSPGKTVEGMIAAIVTGILATIFCFRVLAPWITGSEETPQSWLTMIVFGIVVTLAGMIGDLAESLIKRDMGQKDASKLMPGLGGVLDVLDSIVAAAPAAYVCWLIGLVGPGGS